MPSSAIGAAAARYSRPLTLTRPAVGSSRPAIIRIVVDLPAPFGPRKPVTIPGRTAKSRPSTASFSPYRLLIFSTSIIECSFHWCVLAPPTLGTGRPAGDRPSGHNFGRPHIPQGISATAPKADGCTPEGLPVLRSPRLDQGGGVPEAGRRRFASPPPGATAVAR